MGNNLRPSRDHLPMARFYTPDEFAFLKHEAMQMGLRHVESGPLVRSSYHAHEQAQSTGFGVGEEVPRIRQSWRDEWNDRFQNDGSSYRLRPRLSQTANIGVSPMRIAIKPRCFLSK